MAYLEDVVKMEMLRKKYEGLMRVRKDSINLNPLQTAGRLTPEAKRALIEYGDGYSVCDHCTNGVLDEIRSPPIYSFIHEDLPKFLDCDVVRITHGAREGKFMIMHTLVNPGDTILVDENRHYTTNVAAERAGLNVVTVPHSGDQRKIIDVEDYASLIKEHKPKLIVLTYPDGNVGNLPDAKRLGEISKTAGVPYLINAAYSMGRMPLSMKDFGADFIIGSGHKSMASAGPVGILGMTAEMAEKVLKKSELHSNKELECLGCTVRGVPIITLMASFPQVVERVEKWEDEVEKAQWFSREMENLGGVTQLGEKPHRHDLMSFQTDIFYDISRVHPKKRAFLYEELKENGIYGPKHGITKSIKISTYGTPREDLLKVLGVFRDVVKKYGK